MMKRSRTAIFITLSIFPFVVDMCPRPDGVKPAEYEAFILVEPEGELLRMTAQCLNNTEEDSAVRYEFEVWKKGRGGKTSSVQSGTVLVCKKGRANLASLSIRAISGDRYRLELKVYKDDTLVGYDIIDSVVP